MAQAAQQQSTGIEEVNTAVTQMDQVTQQNAAMVEQSTAASRNLATETMELAELVSFFKVGEQAAAANRRMTSAVTGMARSATRPLPKAQQKSTSSGGRRSSAALATRAATQPREDEWQEF
jgi:methyl-accepting chemotaxis protein